MVNLPIVGARGEPDVGYECEATNRILMTSERPNSLVSLPELDCFVRRAFDNNTGEAKGGQRLGLDAS